MILVSLATLVLSAPVVHQQPEWESASPMPAVVKRALSQQPRWRFTGTRIVSVKRGPELVQHTEFITRDGWNLRIEFPGDSTYSGQVIVETEADRRHFDAKKNVIHVTPPRREPLFQHMRGAWRGDKSFVVSDAPGERIAGFATRLVKVVDTSGNRLQELNIEPRSGIVLARRIFDEVGSIAGSFEFKEINLHPTIDSSAFVLKRIGARVTTPIDDLRRIVAKSDFVPAYLPASSGFLLDSARIRDIAGQRVLMSQYISRRGRIMLFQLSVGVDPATLNRQAPKHIHTVTSKVGGRWFVIVGPVEVSELRSGLSTLRVGSKTSEPLSAKL